MNKSKPLPERQRIANKLLADLVVREPSKSPPATPKKKPKKAAAKKDQDVDVKPTLKRESPVNLPPTKPIATSLVDLPFVLTLVFGGCCSNVWAYEYLLKIDPKIGTALTFSQMMFITIISLPSFLQWDRTRFMSIPYVRLKDRQVPFSQWAMQVLVHTTGSLLNNWAFAFHIPLSLQIVFRSAGLVVSMLFGRLFLNKQYSAMQVASVLLVTMGVILATLSRMSSLESDAPVDMEQYSIGITMLFTSLLLTGVLGLLQEKTYTKYGPCWQEGVFYTHFLSLPVFLFLTSHVMHGFNSLSAATYRPTPTNGQTPHPHTLVDEISRYLPYISLLANLVTQLICVSGVNQLTSRVSSVSTNLVLTTRKAISLCFSVWWFNNGWNLELGVGAGMVFLGSLLYTVASSSSSPKKDIKAKVKTE